MKLYASSLELSSVLVKTRQLVEVWRHFCRKAKPGFGLEINPVTIMADRDTGRSRGFRFVEMANREEGYNAIAAVNGAQVDGCTLNVNEACPKVEGTGGNAGGRSDRGSHRGARW